MDPIALVYYAVICAGLAGLSPRFKTLMLRLGIGAVVGLVAAGMLPAVHQAFGL